MGRFAEASRGARHALRAAAKTLHGAAATLEDAQRCVEGICENLLGEVSRLRAARPRSASSELAAQIRGLCGAAAELARGKVEQARHALEQAKSALDGEESELNRTFTALTDAGSDRFGTGWGKPAGWQHVTAAQPGRPTPGSGQVTMAAHHRVAHDSSHSRSGADVAAVTDSLAAAPLNWAGPAPPAHVKGWISQAIKALEAHGIPASKLSPSDIWIIIQHESVGDPSAVNNTDSNAAAGTPSMGIMQTIKPTFNSYALAGHGDILNPVDNIIAGVRYALARYGSLDAVPGVVAVRGGQPYVGY